MTLPGPRLSEAARAPPRLSQPRLVRAVDLETTGLGPPAEVVEIGYVDLVVHDPTPARPGDDAELTLSSESHWPVRGFNSETTALHRLDATTNAGTAPFDARAWVRRADREAADWGVPLVLAAHVASFEAQWLDAALETVARPGWAWICTRACARIAFADGRTSFALRALVDDVLVPEGGWLPAAFQPAHRALPDARAVGALVSRLVARGWTVDRMIEVTREDAAARAGVRGRRRRAGARS